MELYTYDHYESNTPEEGEEIGYGDLKQFPLRKDVDIDKLEHKETYYLMPRYMTGSDYSNSCLVEVSNHRVFLEQFKEVSGVHDVSGGFGTYAIAIRLDVYLSNDEIREMIDSLEDYPLIDEGDHSKLTGEKEEESWEGWVHVDAFKALQKSHPTLEEIEEPYDFQYQFNMAAEESNTDWENESADNMWINLNDVIPYLRDRALVHLTPEDELPLLISHEWTSNKAQEIFEQKLNDTFKPSPDDWASNLIYNDEGEIVCR